LWEVVWRRREATTVSFAAEEALAGAGFRVILKGQAESGCGEQHPKRRKAVSQV
jgi:hypothetical protein